MADWAGNIVDKIEVLSTEEKQPVLYDAKGQPLTRPTGFRAQRKETDSP